MATHLEKCNAFEAKVEWWTEMTREVIENIESDDDESYRKIRTDFICNFHVVLERLIKAFEDVMRKIAGPWSYHPRRTIRLAARSPSDRRFCDVCMEFGMIPAGETFREIDMMGWEEEPEEDEEETLRYLNAIQGKGRGERHADCAIRMEPISDETPGIAHVDGACKNTFCKTCNLAWVKNDPAGSPTCPTFRFKLQPRPLATYLKREDAGKK